MPQLELAATELIGSQRAERLATDLRRHLDVADPYTIARKSADQLPQYIQLLGHAALWATLAVPATVFLTSYLQTLGRRAADASWDGVAALLKKDKVKPLADVATALADAKRSGIEIVVGLDIPDRYFGTALHIAADSAEEIAHALAVFVTHADQLSVAMKAEVEAGRAPLGRALITLEKDGGLTVRWPTKDFAEHEKRISLSDSGTAHNQSQGT